MIIKLHYSSFNYKNKLNDLKITKKWHFKFECLFTFCIPFNEIQMKLQFFKRHLELLRRKNELLLRQMQFSGQNKAFSSISRPEEMKKIQPKSTTKE